MCFVQRRLRTEWLKRRSLACAVLGTSWGLAVSWGVVGCGGAADSADLSEQHAGDESEPDHGAQPAPSEAEASIDLPATQVPEGYGAPHPGVTSPPDPDSESPTPILSPPDDVPPEDVPLRECDDGTIVGLWGDSYVEALAGCTSVYGLQVYIPLDLTPLRSLRRIGEGGLDLSGVSNLTGLENLEETDALYMIGSTPDLSVLRSLRRIGTLNISYSELVDFTALGGNATVERELSLSSNAQLRSLAGLSIDGQLSVLALSGSPLIEDVEVLRRLTAIENRLDIGDLGLRDVGVLENLREAAGAGISVRSDTIVDITGLGGLRSVGALSIGGPALTTVPEFSELATMGSFSLSGVTRLESSPSFPLVTSMPGRLEISFNEGLVSMTGFSSLESVGTLHVYGNPALLDLAFGSLREATDELMIANNPSLDGGDVATAFAAVEGAAMRRIAPDQAGVTQQPCPWTDDFLCDEDMWIPGTVARMCAPGADPVCLMYR